MIDDLENYLRSYSLVFPPGHRFYFLITVAQLWIYRYLSDGSTLPGYQKS